MGDVEQAVAFAKHEEVVARGEQTENEGYLGVVLFPPVQVDERHQCDGQKHRTEGKDHPRTRLDGSG